MIGHLLELRGSVLDIRGLAVQSVRLLPECGETVLTLEDGLLRAGQTVVQVCHPANCGLQSGLLLCDPTTEGDQLRVLQRGSVDDLIDLRDLRLHVLESCSVGAGCSGDLDFLGLGHLGGGALLQTWPEEGTLQHSVSRTESHQPCRIRCQLLKHSPHSVQVGVS